MELKELRFLFLFLFAVGIQGMCRTHAACKKTHRIAFIADAHVQNVAEHPELVRSMESQVQSTRLFNENYFALVAALEDVVKRGISRTAGQPRGGEAHT